MLNQWLLIEKCFDITLVHIVETIAIERNFVVLSTLRKCAYFFFMSLFLFIADVEEISSPIL